MPKRKTEETSDTEGPVDVKKVSKKDKLLEARKNAQAWAEAEKTKNDKKKKELQAAATTGAADESMESDGGREDDENESVEPQVKKRVRMEHSSTPSSNQKSPSSLQNAKEAAKQWAEEEKKKMKQKSVPAATSHAAKPASNAAATSVGKSPARPSKSTTPKKTVPVQKKNSDSTPVAAPVVAVPVYPAGAFIVQQPGPEGTPFANGASGYMMFVQGSPPFAQAATTSKRGDDDDDDDVPPPPALEQHVSQQILGNAEASLRNQPTVDSFHPDVHKAAVNVVRDEEIDEAAGEDDSEPIVVDEADGATREAEILALQKRLNIAVKGAFVSAFIAFVLFTVYFTPLFGNGMTNGTPTLLCYLDSTPGQRIACPEGDGVPCPTGGVCSDGGLVECSSVFHEVSGAKDSCIVAVQYKNLTAALFVELEDQAKKSCLRNNFPIVKYSSMLQAQPELLANESPELVQLVLGVEFYVENDDETGLFIGLPDDYKLTLPMSCHMSDAFKGSLEAIGSYVVKFLFSVWSLFLIFLGVVWNCTWTYPLSSLIGFLIVCAIGAIKKADDVKRKKILNTANMRQMAYSTLQDNPQCPHLVVHIRDEIAFCLAENDKKERRHLIKEIWPTVVSDIKLDNRVRKSQRLVDGVPSDAWQWVAAVAPKATRFAPTPPAESTTTKTP
jgi:hypothetical protein